ncbi:MAG: hypothetical protein M1829_003973 [Trizodia sp. TS-e1964]|nr:MAG: hypothetical protein M1829_003973 [Trizodia sp. TS-e1964]
MCVMQTLVEETLPTMRPARLHTRLQYIQPGWSSSAPRAHPKLTPNICNLVTHSTLCQQGAKAWMAWVFREICDLKVNRLLQMFELTFSEPGVVLSDEYFWGFVDRPEEILDVVMDHFLRRTDKDEVIMLNRSYPQLKDKLYCALDSHNRLDCLVQSKDFTASGLTWQAADVPWPLALAQALTPPPGVGRLARRMDGNPRFELKTGVQLEPERGSELAELVKLAWQDKYTLQEHFTFFDTQGGVALVPKPAAAECR